MYERGDTRKRGQKLALFCKLYIKKNTNIQDPNNQNFENVGVEGLSGFNVFLQYGNAETQRVR